MDANSEDLFWRCGAARQLGLHLVQHFLAGALFDRWSVWGISALAICAGLLSFVGAFLLLKRG